MAEPPAAIPAEQVQTVAACAGAGRTDDAHAGAVRPGPRHRAAGPDRVGRRHSRRASPGGPGVQGPAGPGAGPAATRRWLAAGAAVAAVVVVYLVIAAAAHAFPFAKPATPDRPADSPDHADSPGHARHDPGQHARHDPGHGIAPLAQLLPADIPVSSCTQANPADYHFAIPGTTQVLDCQSGNWQVTAFQMDSYTDYMTALQNFNNWIAVDPSSAGTNCPPQGSSPAGDRALE